MTTVFLQCCVVVFASVLAAFVYWLLATIFALPLIRESPTYDVAFASGCKIAGWLTWAVILSVWLLSGVE